MITYIDKITKKEAFTNKFSTQNETLVNINLIRYQSWEKKPFKYNRN